MAIRKVIMAGLLLSSPLVSAKPPPRDPTARGKLNKLIRDLERIIENQDTVKEGLAETILGSHRHKQPSPRLLPPEQVTISASENVSVTVGIDWWLYKESQLPIKVEKWPADADIEVPAEIDLDEVKHPERFEIPVTAGKKPGVYKLILTPFRGEPVEFKIAVK